MKIVRGRLRADDGATAVEYALVIGLVSLLMVGAAVNLGGLFSVWAAALIETVGALLS